MEASQCSWVGSECGHHASYTFYKAFKFHPSHRLCASNGKDHSINGKDQPINGKDAAANGKDGPANGKDEWKVLSLGQFFFTKIWGSSDLVSVGELQLLWEDKTTGQMMSSLRLYLLPEFTTEGRLPHHGEDELVAVVEKAVLRVVDLLDWLVDPSSVAWDRGLKGIAASDCTNIEGVTQFDPGLNHKFSPLHSDLDLKEVERERKLLGDEPHIEDTEVLILPYSRYCRYRGMLKRLEGVTDKWMHNSLVMALGGFTTNTRRTFIMYAREFFDYPELEEHPFLCNHLAPKLKGRPRKKKKLKREGSPDGSEHDSNSSESSVSTSVSLPLKSTNSPRIGAKKDLLAMLSQKNTKEEQEFLKKLIKFMEKRCTPIERPPMLGFKQIDLHMFFSKVWMLGGYDGCMGKKSWKSVYDDLGGNPQNTSAATCTRRHYEKFLLPYEQYLRGEGEGNRKRLLLEDPEDTLDKAEPVNMQTSPRLQHAPGQPKDKRLNSPGSLTAPPQPIKDAAGVKDTVPPINKLSDENKSEVTSPGKAEMAPQNLSSSSGGSGPYLGIKPLQLLADPAKINKSAKEASKLQMDDLIILPNNMNHVEEGGSALQNLAKIASRYSSSVKDKSRSLEFSSPNAKKPRLDERPGIAQPLPPSASAKKAASSHGSPGEGSAASSLLQQFSRLPAGLLAGWPPSGFTPAPSSEARVGQAAPAPATYSVSDPSKIGADGYNLLKYYEQQLKSLQQGITKLNGVKEPSTSSKKDTSKTNKSKLKVCKPPPDTKRPPRLMQTPCLFQQTDTIYANPQSELTKAKDAAAKSSATNPVNGQSNSEIMDLSTSSSVKYKAPPALASRIEPDGVLNLAKDIAPPSPGMLDLSVKRDATTPPRHATTPTKQETPRASPFSAEALFSKSSPKLDTPKILPPLSMGIRGILDSEHKPPPSHSISSPAIPRASPAPPSHPSQSPKPPTSPWHIPPSHSTSFPSFPKSDPLTGKPAAPVAPVVRSNSSAITSLAEMSSLFSSASIPASLPLPPTSSFSLPGITTDTTFSSLSSLSSSGFQSSPLPHSSNPYLHALIPPSVAAGLHKPPTSAPGYPPLDPAAQYYAALYNQQMSAYSAAAFNQYAAAAANLRPGLPSGSAGMELQALQAYKDIMTRSVMGSAQPAANPYAALYAGLSGIPGYSAPAFPPPRKDP